MVVRVLDGGPSHEYCVGLLYRVGPDVHAV